MCSRSDFRVSNGRVTVTYYTDVLVLFPKQPEYVAAGQVNGNQERPKPGDRRGLHVFLNCVGQVAVTHLANLCTLSRAARIRSR